MIKVLQVKLFDSNIESVIELVLENCSSGNKQNLLISDTDAHGIVIAQKDEEFREILNSFYISLPDGMPSIWIGRLKGVKEMQRCYGPDLFMETMKATADKNINHFFCGGKKGVADELKKAVGSKFNNCNIVGTYSLPFRKMLVYIIKKAVR